VSAFVPGDKVVFKEPGDIPHRALEWVIVEVWDTNSSGLRAYLKRKDESKKRGVDRCAAQLDELERVI
jgi:hypothetical protein